MMYGIMRTYDVS